MSIDLAKLTPLTPGNWTAKRFADDPPTISVEMTHDDWAFACLSRRAFDVMMRRKWWPVFAGDSWAVGGAVAMTHTQRVAASKWAVEKEFTDPFTALVETEKWYVANVESGR